MFIVYISLDKVSTCVIFTHKVGIHSRPAFYTRVYNDTFKI